MFSPFYSTDNSINRHHSRWSVRIVTNLGVRLDYTEVREIHRPKIWYNVYRVFRESAVPSFISIMDIDFLLNRDLIYFLRMFSHSFVYVFTRSLKSPLFFLWFTGYCTFSRVEVINNLFIFNFRVTIW